MDGSIEVEKHMLAKEKSAVPLGLTEPFAAVEWKIIEMGILVVLIYTSGTALFSLASMYF
jgi:hypothetical protein